jgi:hypothetical protein
VRAPAPAAAPKPSIRSVLRRHHVRHPNVTRRIGSTCCQPPMHHAIDAQKILRAACANLTGRDNSATSLATRPARRMIAGSHHLICTPINKGTVDSRLVARPGKIRCCYSQIPRADENRGAHGLEIAIIWLLQFCHGTKREARRVSVRRRVVGRGRCAHLVAASIALLPALAGCSSSSSVEYATDAYPSQSLVDVLKASTASPPPAQTAAPPPPSPAVAAANEPRPAAPTVPAAAVAPAPAAAPVAAAAPAPAPPDDSDPVAAAYPSVSLIDLLTGPTKPAPR